MTGRSDPPSASTVLALRKLLIEGRAAAWSQLPADQGIEIASELASSIAAEMAKREKHDFLSAAELPNFAPDASVLLRETEIKVTPATSVPQTPVFMPQSTPDEPEYDPTISAVIERLIVQKDHAGTSSVTQRQYRSFGALFIQIIGLTDVRSIRKSHCARFREILQKMPKSWGKSPTDAAASLDDMLAKARALPTEKVGLSPGTINRHLAGQKTKGRSCTNYQPGLLK